MKKKTSKRKYIVKQNKKIRDFWQDLELNSLVITFYFKKFYQIGKKHSNVEKNYLFHS